MYWLQLMDKYAANWSVLLIAISECILVAWVYGANRFLDDVQQMIGPRGRLWRFFWTWMWKVITPAALFFILCFNWVEYEPLRYGTYIYPKWADVLGWVISMLPVLVIVGLAVVSCDAFLNSMKSLVIIKNVIAKIRKKNWDIENQMQKKIRTKW